MPWVRFDDQFPINRKVTRLSDAAFRLHVSAVFWCARNLTDGVVPEEDLDDVSARVRTPGRFVPELLDRGLWHEVGTECSSPNCPADPNNAVTAPVTADKGWIIHDYLDYQPSKDQVLTDRAGSAERQKRWRERQKALKQDHNGVSNGVSNGGSNAAPSRPVPSSSPNGEEDPPNPPRKRGTADQGTRLPDGFQPTPEMVAWARTNAPSCGMTDHDAFCDHWRGVPGAKGKKLDWPGTWRNWMRREHEKRQPKAVNGSARGRPQTPPTTSPRDRWRERD